MTDLPDLVATALESHDAFTARGDAYDLETTVFETTVTADDAAGKRDGRFSITVVLPTLDAAVAGEVVAEPVEDGWFETLERRLADVFTVAHTSTHEEPAIERDADEVRVHLEYTAWDAAEGVDDAKALIEFVEGTFAQGIIPGYDYRGEAATLLENAQNRGQQAADGDGSGGMPM
ncbi:hypothetical protein C488_09689 [Natrinema pellirubrum DSM 15624]|uniref:YbjN domain-containing protein n=1 Tax=Natrinema pellirubrum (strain DSM 15624 / CIP 106293 / JCM 10476 / NCIMB 786 / 157) TaxID=797303 RepID=L0JRB1_NATP1|nr:DUF5813 family protein [Natrinema pellirubrum]AGB32911.1 hypothetical protein Natpe_3119 [Natrinema pellirubrum DSM 15624]ELY75671.1 hypothetical protein C488_09689 [Natrinema pellirubrum DSM 15624]